MACPGDISLPRRLSSTPRRRSAFKVATSAAASPTAEFRADIAGDESADADDMADLRH
jgi:hypothetical protein